MTMKDNRNNGSVDKELQDSNHKLRVTLDAASTVVRTTNRVNGCRYFEWHDEALPCWAKDLINEMKLETKMLQKENNRLNFLGVKKRDGLEEQEMQLCKSYGVN
ncbi:unnamed protein product [Cuscuta epithymum]|uniref:Uncharacterized protein n=1 Tax=Cuscuta epithymum TaxID=186058 RepID=A0AAV0EVU7_9ASTE|nr:unnamed protein product [Cuscuta epithymum]